MRTIRVNPGSLLATEGTTLDMERVRHYYILFRKKSPVEDVVLVKGPSRSNYYIADGNHTAYGALLAQVVEIDGKLLEADLDVKSELSETKGFSTLDALLAYCLKQHESSMEIGIEFICDYTLLQPKPNDQDSY